MDKNPGIYEILNTVNGKRYIGSAATLAGRQRQHWHRLRKGDHDNPHLQAAWNKHGESSFKFLPILTCQKSMLIFYEQQLLDKVKPEYNLAMRAGSQLGLKHTEAARAKMSVTRRKTPPTEAQRAHLARMTAANRGRKRKPEEIAHLRGNTFAKAGAGKKKNHGARVSAGLLAYNAKRRGATR